MQKHVMFTMSWEDFQRAVAKIVRENTPYQHSPNPVETKYYTREEVAQRLRISLPTLHKYTQEGKIEAIYIGCQVRYSEQAIKNALKTRNSKK